MKLLITCALLLTLTIPVYSQQTDMAGVVSKPDYLRKSKHQKTAAWILTSAGTAGLLVTLTADAAQATEGFMTSVLSLGYVEPTYKSLTVPYLLSAAGVLSGVTLFIVASKTRKKAEQLVSLPYLKTERAWVLQRAGMGTRTFTAVAVRIPL